MNNILNSYIPKFLINLNRSNEDIIFVSSSNFSPEGDVYELDLRTVAPNVIQTTQSLNELQPEVSDTYPFKIVTPIDIDGATLVLTSRNEEARPTASQHYYAPTYFDRYKSEFMNSIDKAFTELSNTPLVSEETELNTVTETTTVAETVTETKTEGSVSKLTTTTTTVEVDGEETDTSTISTKITSVTTDSVKVTEKQITV